MVRDHRTTINILSRGGQKDIAVSFVKGGQMEIYKIVDPSSAVLEKKSKNQFNDIEELCDDSKDIGKRVAVS